MLCSNEKLPTCVFNKDPTEAERASRGGGVKMKMKNNRVPKGEVRTDKITQSAPGLAC